jgi:hypothetical protein
MPIRLPVPTLPLILMTLAASGCGSMEYKDTNAAVDADPLCASSPDQPGEPGSLRCKRETSATFFSTKKTEEPLDLSGKSRDGNPR